MHYTIAHIDELYASGGLYDSTVSKELFILVDNTVQLLAEVYPGGLYTRNEAQIISANKAFCETLHQIFDVVTRDYRFCAPSLALKIEQCYVHDNVLYIGNGTDLAPFYPTYRVNDRPYVRALVSTPAGMAIANTLSGTGRRLLYLGSAGSFNYGHWLVDDMPRLKWLLDDPQPTTIIMQTFPGMDAIRTECVKYLTKDMDAKIEFVGSMETVACHNLTYVTPVSFHPYLKNAAAMRHLREAVRPELSPVKKVKDRIYIKRRQERGRFIKNSQAVEALMKHKGFTIIDPESHSFAEQAAIFAQAKIIVGTMCAAMCNSIFSEAGTQLIYLAPNDWIEPFYWDLASTLGHSYTAIHGTRAMAKPEPHLDDFSIDIEVFKIVLNDIS